MITVTATCPRCGARFTRHVLTAWDAALVTRAGVCDRCYEAQELARDMLANRGEEPCD